MSKLNIKQNQQLVILRIYFISMASRSRCREFSEVRLDHSARSLATPAKIKQAAHHVRQQPKQNNQHLHPNHIKQRTITNNNRSFHDFRSSSKRNKTDMWLCVGCYNQDLSKKKREKSTKERQLEKTRMKNTSLADDDDVRHLRMKQRYNRQQEKALEYNLKQIKAKQRQKEKEKRQRSRQADEIHKQEQRLNRQRQQVLEINNRKRQQLQRQLKQQIQRRKARRAQEERQRKSSPIVFIPEKKDHHAEAQRKYRQDLLKQIDDNLRKKRQKQFRNQERRREQEEILRIQEAQNDRKIRQEKIRRKRQIQLQEERRKQIVARKQQQILQKKREEEHWREVQAERAQHDLEQRQNKKRTQVDKYLGDLKKQMDVNRRRREQELRLINNEQKTSYFFEREEITKRECDSCEKRYPEMYLTKVVNQDL